MMDAFQDTQSAESNQNSKKEFGLKGSGQFERTGIRDDIVDFLNDIFWKAKELNVSDIHFQSDAYGCKVRFRMPDMKMMDFKHLSPSDAEAVDTRLRAQSKVSRAETRTTHSSRFHLIREKELLNIRISFQPTIFGQNIDCRLLGKADDMPLSELDMPDELKKQYMQALGMENGLIVVSGPTGSGKTKTLVASISHLNDGTKNISTIEDPVEIVIEGSNQTNVTPQLSFADGLRNILRQDPDIILIGETRDSETAQITVNAAFTGHLTLTSTHARNAAETITRLIRMGVEPYSLAESLLCFFSQRLLKRLCPNCYLFKAPEGRPPTRFPKSAYSFLNPKGCQHCDHKGFIGRIPVFEMGFNTPRLRKAIFDHDLEGIRQALMEQENFRTLAEAALDLSAEGLVDYDDAVSLARLELTSENQL